MKRLFGGIDLTWKRLVIFAVMAGLYTGFMAMLPAAKDTSFADITISFEWWVLFGIIIIVNSASPVDSALKCFIFFLISQPLVYLVQVPFNVYGWGIFRFYRGWFIWTLCTFPMGFVGYYMKKEKWWSLLILVPMLLFVGYHYYSFFTETMSFFPRHLLSAIFCAVTVILYPLVVFSVKKLRLGGVIISIVILIAFTVMGLISGGNVYNTVLLVNNGSAGVEFDDNCKFYLEDDSFGRVYVDYEKNIEDYMLKAELTRTGETRLIMETPDGEKREFELVINRHDFNIQEITDHSE